METFFGDCANGFPLEQYSPSSFDCNKETLIQNYKSMVFNIIKAMNDITNNKIFHVSIDQLGKYMQTQQKLHYCVF